MLQAIALGRAVPPVAVLAIVWFGLPPAQELFLAFLALFFVLGALANGLTIAVIGYLMDISPETKRPSYSGYFNALTAPAYLFPLVGGVLVALSGFALVFSISSAAACAQFLLIHKIKTG